MKTKLSGRFWLALTIFSLIGQVAWVVENMYFNVFIYNMFSASAAEMSLMVAASSIVATLSTIFIGAIKTALGKRKIFAFILGRCYLVGEVSDVYLPNDGIRIAVNACGEFRSPAIGLGC